MKYRVEDANGNVVVVDNRAEAWEVAENMNGDVTIETIFDFNN